MFNHVKLWEKHECVHQKGEIGKAGRRAKWLLYFPINNILMWHLIKINRNTTVLKEETNNRNGSSESCWKRSG